MSGAQKSDNDKYLLGAAVLFAIVAGGNSAPGYYVDSLIQFLTVLVSGFVLWRHPEAPVDKRLTALIMLSLLAVAIQLLPLPSQLPNMFQNIITHQDTGIVLDQAFRPISLNLGRTLEALAWVAALGLFTMAISKLRFEQAYGLVPIFLVGVVCHLVAGLIQYSSASVASADNLLSFTLQAGFFANSNHFSALIFVSIPVAFAYFYDRRRLSVFALYLIFALLALLAVGSRAGVLLGLGVTVLSALIIFRRRAVTAVSALAGAAILGVFLVGVWARIAQEGLQETSRGEFARTTLQGIMDNLVLGVGYGNFVTAYPYYERTQDIVRTYVNHAHNDFLELLFEGGIVAAILIVWFLAVFVVRVIETARWPLHYGCALAILFLLLHSLVDYPLRTMAISISFCMLIALLFHRGIDAEDQIKTFEQDKNEILEPENIPEKQVSDNSGNQPAMR